MTLSGMMTVIGILLYTTSCCIELGLTLDCSSLTHIDPVLQEPANGLDLPYCQTSEDQCCTPEYLQREENSTLKNLRLGLQQQFNLGDNYRTLDSITNETLSYMQQRFATGFIDRLPGVYSIDSDNQQDLLDMLTPLVSGLGSAPSLTQINTTMNDILQRLMEDIVRDYIQRNNIFAINNLQARCYRDELYEGYINTTFQSEVVLSLQKLLTSISLFNNITTFYTSELVPLISSIPLPSQCIERSLSLQCASCQEVIPDLCHSVCDSLVLGCYSPYRRTLVNQFNILWNVTNQLLQVARVEADSVLLSLDTPTTLLTLDLESTDAVQDFINAVATSCSFFVLNFAAESSTALPAANFPVNVLNNATKLNGSYEYSGNGPLVCDANPRMNCWNGQEEVAIDQSQAFNTDDILEQNDNPVVQFNRSELVQIAASIGTPVSDFLNQQMIPEGLLIPSATEFQLEIPIDIVTTSSITAAVTRPAHTSSTGIPHQRQTTSGVVARTQSSTMATPTNRLMNTVGDSAETTCVCLGMLLFVVTVAMVMVY